MGCSSCNTKKKGDHKGCANRDSCSTAGFEKLGVFNFLADIQMPNKYKSDFNLIELRFKNGRKEFYHNNYFPSLYTGELVTVEGESGGYDIGRVSLTGELVKIQMKKKEISPKQRFKKILRKTSQEEFNLWEKMRQKEDTVMIRTREITRNLGLNMKISDIEYQADGSSATFYYIADDRVDFRELIKILGHEFQIRVLMRQIGARQEAGKIGGIGSCGRELCCATWLTDFRTVNTTAARYQQLSINPQKLTGQCGKLKCCLNYELDMYMEAFADFPDAEERLHFKEGVAVFFKADIFKKVIWYSMLSLESGEFLDLSLEKAKEVIALNKKNIHPSLAAYMNKSSDNKNSEAVPRVQSRGQILKNSIEKSKMKRDEMKKNDVNAGKNNRNPRKSRDRFNNKPKKGPQQEN